MLGAAPVQEMGMSQGWNVAAQLLPHRPTSSVGKLGRYTRHGTQLLQQEFQLQVLTLPLLRSDRLSDIPHGSRVAFARII